MKKPTFKKGGVKRVRKKKWEVLMERARKSINCLPDFPPQSGFANEINRNPKLKITGLYILKVNGEDIEIEEIDF